MKLKRRSLAAVMSWLFIITSCSTFLAGCGTKGEEMSDNVPEHVFVYAENQPEDYPATKAAKYFAQLVHDKTAGRIKILVESDGKLGDENSVIIQMSFGGVDFTRVSLSSLAGDIPELNVLFMPYLYSSKEAMWKVLEGEIGRKFTDAISEKGEGIRALSWYDAGARSFYSVKPVEGIGDLKGLNIRVQEWGVMSDMVTILGANPVQMIYSEVNQGLLTGAIDGAENNWSSYEYSSHYETARYCLVDEHTRIPEVQLISESAWGQLSEEDKDIIQQCATESAVYERTLWEQAESEARKDVESDGVHVVEISDGEKTHFQEVVQQLYDKYCSDYMDIIEQIRQIQ